MKYSRLFIVTFIVILFNLAIYNSSFTKYINYKIYDILDGFTSKKENPHSSVVIVDIDEKSLSALGQWPWNRIIIANLLKQISKANPASIGMDMIFPEKDRTSPKSIINFYKKFFSLDVKIKGLPDNFLDNDKIFEDVLKHTNVSLSVFLQKNGNSNCSVKINNLKIVKKPSDLYKAQSILCNSDIIKKSGKGIGFVNISSDRDGIFRRLPLFIEYKNTLVPILSLSMLMNIDSAIVDTKYLDILGKRVNYGKRSEVLLRFYNKRSYVKISAVDVLSGRISLEALKGKFVIIGTTSAGLHDIVSTPSAMKFPGVYVLATLIDNILQNDLRYEPLDIKWVNFLLANIFLIWLIYLMLSKKYIKLVLFFTFILVVVLVLSYICLLEGIYIDSAFFITPFIVGFFFLNIISIGLNYREKLKYKQEISKAHTSAIDNMSLVVEIRDTETGAHIKRTKEYVKLIGRKLLKHNRANKELVELMYMAAPLHDIGKVGIPDNILKKNGRLTKDEFEIMKRHPLIGKNILENALKENPGNKLLKIAKNIAYYHHEKWDGTGYPQGLKADEIPLEARIMALADVYDALTSKRVYKESFDFEASEKIIIDGKGTHFDPEIIDIFIQYKDKFREIATSIHD